MVNKKKNVAVSPKEDTSEMQQTSGDDIESTTEIPVPEVAQKKSKLSPLLHDLRRLWMSWRSQKMRKWLLKRL